MYHLDSIHTSDSANWQTLCTLQVLYCTVFCTVSQTDGQTDRQMIVSCCAYSKIGKKPKKVTKPF